MPAWAPSLRSPVLFFGAALALVSCRRGCKPQLPPVLVVGIDGLTYDVLDPLIAAGRCPNFESFRKSGASGVMLSEKPMRSPALWTTVATGRARDEHKIYDFVTGSPYWPRKERSDKQELVTSQMRKTPAIWNLLSSRGDQSLVVGWLNTWPAESIEGAMVAPYVALGKKKQTSIKGKIYHDAQGQSFPESLFAELKPLVAEPSDVDDGLRRRFVDLEGISEEARKAFPRLERYIYTLTWSIASAQSNVAILSRLVEDTPDWDLAMTYFDGTDTLAHRFWLFRQSEAEIAARLKAHGLDPLLAPEMKRRFGRVLDEYYVYVDGLLGRLRERVGEDAIILLVSDHGWGDWKAQAKAPYDHVPFDGEHRLEGVWMAAGPGIAAGEVDAEVDLYDVAPTVLRLRGFDTPEGWKGSVIPMFREGWLSRLPSRGEPARLGEGEAPSISTPTPTPSADDDPEFEDEEMQRLRELGYVE